MAKKTEVVAVIQARMGSTRLPQKTLAAIEGRPMLHWIVQRLKKSKSVGKIIIATTTQPEDGVIEEFAKKEGTPVFRGSVNDIVDRIYQAAKMEGGEIVVRVTADCPLVDAKLLDEMVGIMQSRGYDFFSNVSPPTYPDGLDLEMLTMNCLERLWKSTRGDPFLSEWFRTYIVQNPDKFRIGNHSYKTDMSEVRWTVDEKEDLEFVQRVYAEFRGKGADFWMDDLLALLVKKPEIGQINNRFIRDKAYKDALAAQKK